MKLHNTTPVSNMFLEKQMAELSGSAIRVYLKIVRNTHGWRDKQGNVKDKDWIAHSQFEKTGLSNRSVTNAIEELLSKQLITVTDYLGNDLSNPITRKQAKRVFYSIVPQSSNNSEKTTVHNAKTAQKTPQELRTTRDTFLQKEEKKYLPTERIPDYERFKQIKEQEQRKQLQRDYWS